MILRVLGIDPGSRVSTCVIFEDGAAIGAEILDISKVEKDDAGKCYLSYEYVYNLVEPGDMVLIEKPVYARGGFKALLPLARVHGAMLAGGIAALGKKGEFCEVLPNPPRGLVWDLPTRMHTGRVVPVTVTEWKRRIVGKGNASKEYVAEWVANNYPSFYSQFSDQQDALDAFCIGLMGVLYPDQI